MKRPSPKGAFKQWVLMFGYVKDALAKGHRRYLVASILLHVVVIALMSWSWQSTEAVKTFSIPNSLEARILTQAELDQLPYKKQQRAEAEALEKKRQDELRRKNEEKRQRELERKRLEEAKKKQQEAARKEAARKEAERLKILAQKKKQEEAEDAKRRLEEAKRREAELQAQKAREAEAAKRALAEQEQQELERLERLEQERKERLREQRLAERLKGLEDLKSSSDAPPMLDPDEKTRYMSIIRSRIEARWIIPPNVRNDFVMMRIALLPSGELSKVQVIESSGNEALNQSALRAVRAVNKFEVPSDRAVFDAYFRNFQMSFRPEG